VDGPELNGDSEGEEPSFAAAAIREPRRMVHSPDDDLDVPDFLK
jgi:hypothetical protein